MTGLWGKISETLSAHLLKLNDSETPRKVHVVSILVNTKLIHHISPAMMKY